MKTKVIGLGGIGSHLLSPLCRYLEASTSNEDKGSKKGKDPLHSLVLIDGDDYEAKNASRQEFHDIGNKAEVSAARVKRDYPSLLVEAKPHFVTIENVFLFIEEGDIVFLCVDNHATRKLVSDRCQGLKDVILISGGNEFQDGDVNLYLRRKGKNVTPPLTHLHPEIQNPADRNPDEMSCEELAEVGVPQLIFANLTAATMMLNAFWMVGEYFAERCDLKYSVAHFDVLLGIVQTELHVPQKKKGK